MASSNENSGSRENSKTKSRRARHRTQRMDENRRSRLAKIISLGGLVLSVGTALYRFRKDWVPKVEEMGEDLRDRVERVRHHSGDSSRTGFGSRRNDDSTGHAA